MIDGSIDWFGRFRGALTTVIALLVAPAATGFVLGGSLASLGLVVGAAVTVASASTSGLHAARAAAPAVVVAFVLGSITAASWPWVVVVAAFAGLAGVANVWQATGAFMMAALVATVAPAPGDVVVSLWLGAFTAIGCVYGHAVAQRVIAETVRPPTQAVVPAWLLGVGLAAIGATTSAVALVIDDDKAFWIPMTAIVLAAPATAGPSSRSRERVIGTLLGAVVALAIGMFDPARFVYAAVAVAALFLTVATVGLACRVQATFTTVLVLVAGGAPSQGVAERRIVFTLVGAAVLLAGSIAISWIIQQRPGPVVHDQPDPV